MVVRSQIYPSAISRLIILIEVLRVRPTVRTSGANVGERDAPRIRICVRGSSNGERDVAACTVQEQFREGMLQWVKSRTAALRSTCAAASDAARAARARRARRARHRRRRAEEEEEGKPTALVRTVEEGKGVEAPKMGRRA